MTVYKCIDRTSGLVYFDNRIIDKQAALARGQLRALSDGERDAALAAVAQDCEGEVGSLDDLIEVSQVVVALTKALNPTKDSRRELAIRLLCEGEDPRAVREAADVSWVVLRSWCEEGRPRRFLAPPTVMRFLDAEIEASRTRIKTKSGSRG